MARGTANNEGVVSQANSKEYEAGYDASDLGKSDRSKERGRWIWDPKLQKLVRPWEYDAGNTEEARTAPVMMDRFYENTATAEGVDIGSRRKHREYMHRNGLTTSSDYDSKGGEWDRAEKKRAEGFASAEQKKDRNQRLAREMERVTLMPQAKYDREVKERNARRAARGTGEPTK